MVSPRNNKPASSKNSRYKFIVSACLAGANCTFRAGNKKNSRVMKLFRDGYAIGVCPELTGGLGIPRERCEIIHGGGEEVLSSFKTSDEKTNDFPARVITASGKDVTRNYTRGARLFLAIAKRLGIKKAILKSDSPACGIGRIYNGHFTGTLKSGDGVLAAMLRREGFVLYDEKDKRYV